MAISPVYPVILQNGILADANQVMADFFQIQNDVNTNAAHNGANSDITSLLGLTTPLPISEGGTGAATAGGARTNLGAAGLVGPSFTGGITVAGGIVADNEALSGTLSVAGQTTLGPATGVTQSPGDDTTALATDAFVTSAVAAAVPPSNRLVSAFVRFDASGNILGTPYNVVSVSHLGTGIFQVNFATPFADANYCPVVNTSQGSGGIQIVSNWGNTTPNFFEFNMQNRATGVEVDAPGTCVVVGV